MLDIPTFIVLIGLLVIAAHFFSWLFSLTAIPDGLLLMGIGLLLGPFLGIIPPDFFGEIGAIILTVALVVMLFESGTTLQVGTVREGWAGTLRLTLTSFVLTTIVIGLIIWWLTPLSPLIAFMLGAVLGGTTGAVVIPLLQRIKILPEAEAVLILESGLSDVLSIIVTLALFEAWRSGTFGLTAIAASIVGSFAVASLIGFVIAIAWSLILDRIRHIRNSIFITPALVFILFGVVEGIGASGLVAALVFGITMGNVGLLNEHLSRVHYLLSMVIRPVSLSRRERAFFSELVFLLQTFFFVFVGLSIAVSNVSNLLLALLVTALLLIVRLIAVRASAPHTTLPREAALMAVMVPKGLAPAVLAAFIVQQGIESGAFVQEFTYAVILWSIVITSLLVFLLEKTPLSRLYRFFMRGFGTEEIPDIQKFG